MKKRRLIWIAVAGFALVGVCVFTWHQLTPPPHPSNKTLHRALAGATKLVVRSGGLCHRDASTEKTLFVVGSAEEIADILAHVQIVESESGLNCMCCGHPTLEFYRGDGLVAAIGFHHGRSIRWRGWRGDGLLTAESAAYLVELLQRHGIAKEEYQ